MSRSRDVPHGFWPAPFDGGQPPDLSAIQTRDLHLSGVFLAPVLSVASEASRLPPEAYEVEAVALLHSSTSLPRRGSPRGCFVFSATGAE